MHKARHPKLVLYDNLEGQGREGGGIRMGGTCILMVDDCYLSHTIYGIIGIDTHLD